MKVLGSHVTSVKKFSRKGDVKKHLVRHEAVKPYVCSECSYRFYTEGELKRHQPVHSDFKAFCCGRCGKDFKCKYSVVKHSKKCGGSLPFNFG